MQFIKIDTNKMVDSESPQGKAFLKKKADEAKKVADAKAIVDEKTYFDSVKKQLAEAEQQVKDIKSALK